MMKKFLIFMTILCSGYFMSQTQLELNEIAEKKYEKTWNELNVLQNKLLLKLEKTVKLTMLFRSKLTISFGVNRPPFFGAN